jgi:hypothetical protein
VEEGFTRRVFVPDVRGRDRYLRVTWHKESATLVWSQWQGDRCIGSTRVSLADSLQLVDMITGAIEETDPPPLAAAGPQERKVGN